MQTCGPPQPNFLAETWKQPASFARSDLQALWQFWERLDQAHLTR
jgi:hypothetical protein